MNNKILSISIASYNAEKDILRCLDSMINTSVLDLLDIIVINDGSEDETSIVASKYAKKYPNSIRVINKENGGHGSTINVGITEAVGKYFKIVDSDDWVDKDGIEELVHFLSENDVDLVFNPFHVVSFCDLKKQFLVDPCPVSSVKNKIVNVSDLSGNEKLYMHSMTFKTELMKKVGPIIDEHCFYVDMEYCIYPLIYVKTVCYLSSSVYLYLVGNPTQSVAMSVSIKRRNDALKVITSLVSFYNKTLKSSNLSSSLIKGIVYSRIMHAIQAQYKIYIIMNSREAKNEMDQFTIYLKNKGFYLPVYFDSLFKKIIWFLLLSNNYFVYKVLSFSLRQYKKIENKLDHNVKM